MRKAQMGQVIPVVVVALVVPLLLTMLYLIQANLANTAEDTLLISVTDDLLAAGTNATALPLSHTYIDEDTGLTFNVSDIVEDTNYTIDWNAGTITWISADLDNNSDYAVDYSYFDSGQRVTYDSISDSANDSYDMAGILPIALIGVAVLVALLSAIGGGLLLRR